MRPSSPSSPTRFKWMSNFFSLRRLNVALLIIIVWTVGAYMGSNSRVFYHEGATRYISNFTPSNIGKNSRDQNTIILRNVALDRGSKQAPVIKESVVATQKPGKSKEMTVTSDNKEPSPAKNKPKAGDKDSASSHTKEMALTSMRAALENQGSTTSEKSLTVQPNSEVSNTSSVNTPKPCTFPEIDPFDPSLESVLDRRKPMDCSTYTPNVVYLEKGELKVDFAKVEKVLKNNTRFGHCQYRVLRMKANSDGRAEATEKRGPFNTSIKVEKADENIRVECFDNNKTVISRSHFAFIRPDVERERVLNDSYKVHIDKNAPVETLSVLVVGVDGFAKQHFARSMPKSRDFLLKELGALEMNKHGKTGYSTCPNVLPLLTGRTESELEKDPMWKYQPRGWMDQINEAFVWSDAKRLGYRTALMFDQVYVTAFHYLKRGYNKKPVDHYMRPIVVDSVNDPLMRKPSKNHCFGDQPEIAKLYDYWLQLLQHYNSTATDQRPFFAYSFLTRLTHDDYNNAFKGDELYLQFLKEMKASNALNNTVIVWFSDHGERYGKIRHTYQGTIETSTPYLFYVFPPWFEKKYPEVMRVFKTNQNRLTSHFDTYATLQDILKFKGVVGPKGNLGERSISLFREIPEARTCADAGIPAEFCVCARFSKPHLGPGLDNYLGLVLRDKVMSIIKPHLEKCAELRLASVENILELEEATGAKKKEDKTYRVSIMTEPGNALFEATLRFTTSKNAASVIGEVARTNMYRGQADCMDTVQMRQYCYCKNLLTGGG